MINNVLIFCNQKLFATNSAAASRMIKYARLLAGQQIKVYFVSYTTHSIKNLKINEIENSIYNIESPVVNQKSFVFSNFFTSYLYSFNLARFAKELKGNTAFILYPSSNPTIELPALLIIKWFFRFPLFCEMNELRYAILKNFTPGPNKLKNLFIIAQNKIKYAYYKLNERLSKYFNGLIVISTRLEKHYLKYNNNILRIPILTDSGEVVSKLRPNFDPGKDTFSITFTGQISIKKEGLDLLIKALGRINLTFPDFQLNLYGTISHNDRKIIDKLVKKLGLEQKVVFHGVVKQSKVMAILQKSHLLVLIRPSTVQNNYGFSTKLSEYMNSGTPILISNISDNGMYVYDGINGFIVDNLEERAVATKLTDIIDNYNEHLKTIPLNCYETAKKYFDYRNYSKELTVFITK